MTTTRSRTLAEQLRGLGACDEAVEWVRTQPSASVAWATCERGDWMFWLLAKLSGPPESASRKALVLAACACARLSLSQVPAGETRPLTAIETAEAWARGEDMTLDQVRAAAYAAYAAADADAYAARSRVLKQCADIVRQHYPTPPRLSSEDTDTEGRMTTEQIIELNVAIAACPSPRRA